MRIRLNQMLQHTIPSYDPDMELLFGQEGNGTLLSASWATVTPVDMSLLSADDERITFSMSLFKPC
jgi:hypothetical protein